MDCPFCRLLAALAIGAFPSVLSAATNVDGCRTGSIGTELSEKSSKEMAERTSVLAKSTLGPDHKYATWTAYYNRLFALDADADEIWAKVKTVEEFDSIRSEMRRKMLRRIGEMPERTPLNAKITGVVRRNGYRIEKILFESRPGMLVTGNLYLPDETRFPAPHPAAIEVCGHSRAGKNSPKYQRMAILLAKNGVAAFVVDPLGQGERLQSPEEDSNLGSPVGNHLRQGVLAVLLGKNLASFEIYDAMRAID